MRATSTVSPPEGSAALSPAGELRIPQGADKLDHDIGSQNRVGLPPERMADAAHVPLSAFEIGMHWFPERPGGLNRMYYALAGALPDAGVSVTGMVAGTATPSVDTQGAIVPFSLPSTSLPLRLLRARRTMRAVLARTRPDVIAAHFALHVMPGLDELREYPTVMHFHGPWAAENQVEGVHDVSNWLQQRIESMVYARCRLYIVLSRAFAHILRTRYRVEPARIRIVPGCVDAEHFATRIDRRSARQALGLPTDRPIVLSLRRLVRRMGLEDLIDAMSAVRLRLPDALLVIVGCGSLDAELRERVNARGLTDHVRFMGRMPDVKLPLIYCAADLSVVPTLRLEGFGLTTVESLAAGTPVLVTPVGGLPEAVSGLSDALVLPTCGVQSLAAGVIDALLGTLRLPDAEACRSYVRNNFDIPVVATKVAQVYREAVNQYE